MKKGFTLVELAIVIVIIGLLVGGVLQGQELIRQARIRKVINDVEGFKAAAYTFKSKYNYFPGDVPNATTFWGAGTCPPALGAANATTLTCNGDANGLIGWNVSNSNSINLETYLFWQHLSNAKLIKGTYSGIYGPSGTRHAIINVNTPEAPLGGGYSIFNIGNYTSAASTFPGEKGNTIFYGTVNQNQYETTEKVIGALETYLIDLKQDDGKPGTGRVMTSNGSFWPTCVNGTAPDTATYRIENNGADCGILFTNQL